MKIETKRVYEKPSPDDGYRILVDRIWPRGISRERAGIDLWLKEIAPSTDLRKWFGHDPARWHQFRKRYFEELDNKPEQVASILKTLADQDCTILFAAADTKHNNAGALAEYLRSREGKDGR